MATRPEFWSRMAERYSRSKIPNEEIYERKLRETQEYLTPESEVLEIGCGTGTTAIRHGPHARHILATDYAEGMLEIARKKAEEAGVTNVTFERASAEEIDEGRGPFDMVMAHSILHLVGDRPAVLAKCARLLKPGGVFVSSTFTPGRWHPLRFVLPLPGLFGFVPEVGFFSEADLVAEVEEAGLHVERRWKPSRMSALFLIARKQGT
ncbi:class I SAM-dependent methyltransferase [Histidinibacterium aquaticum]|nr:class I SAM-dependent methyltransferase [Histidinibacterium aquaticum]